MIQTSASIFQSTVRSFLTIALLTLALGSFISAGQKAQADSDVKTSREKLEDRCMHAPYTVAGLCSVDPDPSNPNAFLKKSFPGPGCNKESCERTFTYDPACFQKNLQKLRRSCMNPGARSEQQVCEEAKKEYAKARTKFGASCAKANLQAPETCAIKINKCNYCQISEDGDETCSDLQEGEASTDAVNNFVQTLTQTQGGYMNGSTQVPKGVYAPSASKAIKRFQGCPSLAGVNIDDWRNRAQDARDKLNNDADKISDLEAQRSDMLSNIESAMEEIDNDVNELVEAALEVNKTMEKAMVDSDTQTRDIKGQLAGQLEQLKTGKAEAKAALRAAETNYQQQLDQLYLTCHAASLQQINALQGQVQLAKQQGKYSAGMQKNLLGSAGKSERTAYKKKARDYIQRCLRDAVYQTGVKQAKQAMANAEEAYWNAVKAISNRISQLLSQDVQVSQNNNTNKATIASDAQTDLQKLNRQKQRLIAQRTRLLEKYRRQLQSMDKKIALARMRMAQSQQSLRETESYLSAKQRFSGGKETPEGALDEAMGDYSEVVGAAASVKAACGCDSGEIFDRQRQTCVSACKFLYISGDSGHDVLENVGLSENSQELIETCSSLGSTGSRTPAQRGSTRTGVGSSSTKTR